MEPIPLELRVSPAPVVAFLRRQHLHEPLASHIGGLGFHVLSIPDSEIDYPPETAERNPPNHYETYQAQGILKKAWVAKHTKKIPVRLFALRVTVPRLTRVAAVQRVLVLLFDWDEEQNWKAVETSVSNRVDRIRHNTRHRPVQILCVRVYRNQQPLDENEERARAASLRKRADLNEACVVSAPIETVLQAARKLSPILRQLADIGHKQEASRLHSLVKTNVRTSQAALYVRLQFKIGFYDELRQDWRAAVSNYRDAYDQLTASLNQFPGDQRMEAKAIAEYLNYKLCAILFRMDSRAEAIRQFRGHLRSYKHQVATEELAFEHWAWVARQYGIFGEILEAAPPDARASVDDRWQWPALYYHAAAKSTKSRRTAAQEVCGVCPPGAGTAEGGMRPVTGSYYGQMELIQRGEAQELRRVLIEAESQVQHGLRLVELLSRAYEYFKRRGSCHRMIHGLVSEMAEEYYLQGEYTKAQKLFESITPSYRKEGWSMIVSDTLERLFDCAVKLVDGRRFVQTALELLVVPRGRADLDTWQKAAQVQAELWAVLELPPCPDLDTTMPTISPNTATALRNAGLTDSSPPPFDVSHHSLFHCKVSFGVAEIYASQEFRFSLEITVASPGVVCFQELIATCSEEQFTIELLHNGAPGVLNETSLKRSEDLLFQPGVARSFKFSATADKACDICVTDIVVRLTNAVALKWSATAAEASKLGNGYGWAAMGPKNISTLKVLPPKAKASIAVEHIPPALVDEYFPLTVVTSANEDDIRQGYLSLKPSEGAAVMPTLLDCQLVQLGETISLPAILPQQAGQVAVMLKAPAAGQIALEVSGQYDTPAYTKTLLPQPVSVPCILPFAATFRFSPQKSGGKSDPANRGVVLLQGRAATLEMTLESRSPHDLELICLDIEIHNVRAGRAAAARCRPEDEQHNVAFDDEIPADQAVAKLAVIIAAATPLKRGKANENERPVMLMKTGQHSTHLFQLQLPTAAEDVSLGRAILQWRRKTPDGAPPMPTATSSCDLPVLTVQRAPLVATIKAPIMAKVGVPLGVYITAQNLTARSETLTLTVGRSDDFSYAGLAQAEDALLPHGSKSWSYVLVPLTTGKVQLPPFKLSSARSNGEWFAKFHEDCQKIMLITPN